MSGDHPEVPDDAPALRDIPELAAIFATDEGKRWAAILGNDSIESILAGLDSLTFVPCNIRHEDPKKGAGLAPTNCKFHGTNVACGHTFDRRYPERAAVKLEKGTVAALVMARAMGEPEVAESIDVIKVRLADMGRLANRLDGIAALAYADKSSPTRRAPSIDSTDDAANLKVMKEGQAYQAEVVLGARDAVRALVLDLVGETHTAVKPLKKLQEIPDRMGEFNLI